MTRTKRMLLFWMPGLVVLAASVNAQSIADEHSAGEAPQPKLETSNRDWDFGTVWQGRPLEYPVTLKNVGDAPLVFEDVKSSCGCTVSTKPKSPLAPGESDEITVRYAADTRVGKAHQTITLITNDPQMRTVPITVRGEVKPCYKIEPKSGLVFGSLLSSAREKTTVDVVNQYKEPLELRLKSGQDFGPYQVELEVVEPGQRYRISARTKPPLPSGSLSEKVLLETNLPDIPEIKVTVYGFVPPSVQVRGSLNWPATSVLPLKQKLWIVHAEDQPIRVTGVRASHDVIEVSFQQAEKTGGVEPVGQYRVVVTLPPGNQIPDSGEAYVEILTTADDPQFQAIKVPIRIISPSGAGLGTDSD